MLNIIAKITIWLLRNKKLKGNTKAKVMNALLKNIDSLPLRGSISIDENGNMQINGKQLEADQATSFFLLKSIVQL